MTKMKTQQSADVGSRPNTDKKLKKELKRQKKEFKRQDKAIKRSEKKQRKERLDKQSEVLLNAEKNSEGEDMEKTLKRMAEQQIKSPKWFPLDNAALLFPASERADSMNMFRLSAVLNDPVDPLTLQQALNLIVPRFPSYAASVKKGFFWYYLEPSAKPIVVKEQKDFPCRPIPLDSRNPLIRVTYFSHEISVEFFHVATDGNGGMIFLNSLIACYLKLKNVEINDKTGYLNHLDRPRQEELTDSFQQCADASGRLSEAGKAYKIKAKRLPYTTLILTKGTVSSGKLREKAKQYGLTVTQFITACLIEAIQCERKRSNNKDVRPVIISVPVNLRKLFDSKTLRNFVSVLNIKGQDLSFPDLCESVKQQFALQNTPERFKKLINYNLYAQNNPLLKFVPLPIKMAVLRVALRRFSTNPITTVYSNLGKVEAPAEFSDHVARYEFSLGTQDYSGVALSSVTYGDNAVFTFSSSFDSHEVERLFFAGLVKQGLDVVIDCNYDKEVKL